MNSIISIKKANEPVEVKNEIQPNQPVKKELENYGFVEAGRTGGDSTAFSAYLAQIRDGHIVSASHDEAKQQAEQRKVEQQIENVEKEVRTVETKIRGFEEVQIPDYKKKIQENKDAVNDLELHKMEDTEKDSKAVFNFWTYLVVFIPLTVFLYGFYVSSFHNAFFRDIVKQVSAANASNISSVLNTVFNSSAFTEFNLHWFAPVIFFAFAMVLHQFYDGKSKFRFAGLAVMVLFIFFADGLLAYFIEANNHKIEVLMGMNKGNWVYYKSPVFIMVLVMGFFSCMGWSILLHALREEKEKKNPQAVARKKIALLKAKIKEIEQQIVDLKHEILKSKEEAENLRSQIKSLKKELEIIHYGINELKLNINNFYSGWLRFIVNLDNSDKLKNECEAIKEKLLSELAIRNAA